MPFTVEDLKDLLEILRQRPDWRAEVLSVLLGEEFLSLPQQMQELVAAQRRTDEHLAALSAEVLALAEAQRRTDETVARLSQRVEELAEAQRRTDERLEQLAEAQRRTDETVARLSQRVEELAEAQRRTDERLEQLAAEVRALAEAQRRTEEAFAAYRAQTDARLDRLERGQQRLEVAFERLQREVRNLSNTIGMTVEDEAEDMVGWVLKQRGYTIRKSIQSAIIDGEVDVILLGTDPQGVAITVVVEVKHRLGAKEVHRWAQRVQSRGYQRRLQEAGFPPPYLPYVFAMRVDEPALDAAQTLGIGLVKPKGEQIQGTLIVSGGTAR